MHQVASLFTVEICSSCNNMKFATFDAVLSISDLIFFNLEKFYWICLRYISYILFFSYARYVIMLLVAFDQLISSYTLFFHGVL